MITGERLETQGMGDNRVLEYLENRMFFNCIDIGGVQRPWASNYVKAYVDMVNPHDWMKRYPDMYDNHPEIWGSKLFYGDCESDEVWEELVEFVAIRGKFDFVVCTQMAEHLSYPQRFFEMLPDLADEGYIGVPNKYFELGRGREFGDEGLRRLGLSGSYRGAFPHRWVYTIKDSALWGFPKLSAIETMDFGPLEKELKHYEPLDWGQLGFFWKNDVPTRFINDSDIGYPDPQKAIELYRKELSEGL